MIFTSHNLYFSVFSILLYRIFSLHVENGGSTFFRNVGNHLQDHTAPQPRRSQSTFSSQSRPQISLNSDSD
jgi:hypothetical protein